MPEEIKVIASVQDNATVPLKKIGTGLQQLSGEAVKANDAFTKTGNVFAAKLPQAAKQTETALAPLAPELKNISVEGNKTAVSVTNIGSSLQRITPALSSVSEEVGSLASGFLEMGLAGVATAALGIGISLLASYFNDAAIAAEQSAKATAEARKEYEGIVTTVAKEAGQVEILVESFKKENLSRKQKQTIIEELQKISPAYFGNLDKENTSIQQLTAAYNAYSNSIIRNIELKIREGQLNKVIEERLTLQDKGLKKTNIEIDANGKIIKSTNALFDAEKAGRKQQFNDLLLTEAEQKRLNNLLATEKTLVADIANIKQPQDFNKIEKEKSDERIKIAKEEVDKLNKIYLDVKPILKANPTDFTKDLQEFYKRQAAGTLPTVTVPIKPEIVISNDALFPPEKLVELGDALNKSLQSIAENVGTAFADTLSQAITGGADVGDFFSGLFKTIGAGLKQLGQYFVKAGIEILIVKKALTSNPYLAIAAGLALQVLGGVIQNAISKKQAFATGGLVGGTGNRDTVNALLTPGEFVITKSAVQRIGVDNLAALNRGGSVGNSVIGGNVQAGVQRIDGRLEAIIEGKNIRLVLNRADASLSRVG